MTTASTLSPTCCTCPCTKCTTQSKIDRCYADINKQASIILKAKKQEKEIETAINNLDKLKALISAAATGRVKRESGKYKDCAKFEADYVLLLELMKDITDDKYTKIMQLSNDTATVTKIGSICNLDQVKKLQQKTSSLVDEAIKAVDKFSDAKTKMIEAALKEIDKYEDQIFTILGIPSSATTAMPKPTTGKPMPTTAASVKPKVQESINFAKDSAKKIDAILKDSTITPAQRTALTALKTKVADLVKSLEKYSSKLTRRRFKRDVTKLGTFKAFMLYLWSYQICKSIMDLKNIL